jgi:ubiquinone biosynthesis protein COQ4
MACGFEVYQRAGAMLTKLSIGTMVRIIYKVVDNNKGAPMNASSLPSYDFLRAGRALGQLLKNPDDLPQVFTLIDAVSGTAPHRLLWRFSREPNGKRLLRERPDISKVLADRDGLRKLPDGSLGRAYLAFVESEGISPEGIVEASAQGVPGEHQPGALLYVKERMRDTHDLWHTATGYKGDVAGEIGLLSFTLAQNFHMGVAFIVGAALVRGFAIDTSRLIVDGYRRGMKAKWLPALDWESLLPKPLGEVRAMLDLGSPPEYSPVRTTDLRAQGLLA